jgi:hypothetical protein
MRPAFMALARLASTRASRGNRVAITSSGTP